MTKEELSEILQQDWYENDKEGITRSFWMDTIIIHVEDNCDELTATGEDGNEILCIDWVLNHFDRNKPTS